MMFLIYIGQSKTHFAFIHRNQLIESQELDKGLAYFAENVADLSPSECDDFKVMAPPSLPTSIDEVASASLFALVVVWLKVELSEPLALKSHA